ncbi:MAG: NifU family protein [Chloroflexi bacterium]|nr:NifU family protein [Chloroflexota bacterium]
MSEHSHALASPEERLTALLDNISSYIEQYHGGWVRFDSLEGGVLKVKLGGACQGCALTQTTLQGWIAGTVRQFFPEITEVRAV